MAEDPSFFNQVQQLKAQGGSISFVSGNFNIIHPGHIRFLLFAAEQADHLVVGLYDQDHSVGAYFSNEERIQALKAMKVVKSIVIVKEDLEEILLTLKPDVVIKGKEFEHETNVEAQVLRQTGGKLVFSSGEKIFSSRALLQKQFQQTHKLNGQLQKFNQRYEIELPILRNFISQFSQLKVAVFGDIIMDEYQECLPIGMSQEDPTIAVSPLDSFIYLGGAGIVAAHAANLGAKTTLFSVTGNDDYGDKASQALHRYGVNSALEIDNSRPTTHKLRYRAKDKTLLRVNQFRKHSISLSLVEQLTAKFESQIDQFDLVVFSDFSYGLLCPDLISRISALCRKNGIPVVADSQTSSQIGDLTKFQNLLLTTPTELEARLTTQDENSGLIQVSTNLGKLLNSKNVIVTLGSEGVLIRHHNKQNDTWETDNLPALSDTVTDVAGAGDALLVTASMALICDASIWQAAFLGSIAAAIQVNVRGNVPISQTKLMNELERYTG